MWLLVQIYRRDSIALLVNTVLPVMLSHTVWIVNRVCINNMCKRVFTDNTVNIVAIVCATWMVHKPPH
jgi:hypothetical protein